IAQVIFERWDRLKDAADAATGTWGLGDVPWRLALLCRRGFGGRLGFRRAAAGFKLFPIAHYALPPGAGADRHVDVIFALRLPIANDAIAADAPVVVAAVAMGLVGLAPHNNS